MTEYFDPALEERLKLAEDPSYEGEKMTKIDILQLIAGGIIFPMVLMLVGWFIK